MNNSILASLFIFFYSYTLIFSSEITETVHRESIIAQTGNFERELEKAGAFLDDSTTSYYLNGILKKVTHDKNLSLKVVKSPVFNAFAAPHGTIFICTGLLSRVENEAQMAALLCHEMTHIINDHAYRNLLNAKKNALSSARIRIGLEFFVGELAGAVTNLTLKSAISGYSRELEREADSVGLTMMNEAGYAPIEFRNLFFILKDQIERENIKQPFFFATHPAITERISNYYLLQGVDTLSAAQGMINSESFTKMIGSILQIDGIMKIASGNFSDAENDFFRILKSDTCNSQALIQLGNITRLRSVPQINEHVFKWYYRAKDCDSTGEALRELGFYYLKSGEIDSVTHYLNIYQNSFPNSPYHSVVEDYLKRCTR